VSRCSSGNFRLEETMTTTDPTSPTPTVPVVKWTWDKQHLFYIAAFAYGMLQTLYPVILAMTAHGTPSPIALFGLFVVLISAVFMFMKKPPNSIEAAIDAGKISVSQATTILAKRASLRPPPGGSVPPPPSFFPKGDKPVVIDDPDKTKQF